LRLSWHIAPATPADLPDLAQMMAASRLLQRYGISLQRASAQLEKAVAESDPLLVCREEAGGSPVGLAWLIRTRAFGRCSYLRLLLVAEGFQSRGLGRALLAAAEANATTWSPHLYLLVTTDNHAARRFYERQGYRHVGDLPGLTAPGLDEALYHKNP
jgi:GNAT superfamily N-acetyltransferase